VGVLGFLKGAAESSLASSTGATAAATIPTPSIDPTFAPGLRGPVGTSPRQNYSRVNTGAPPQMDAGSNAQKTMAPRGAEMLPKHASGEELMGKIAGRPMLQDMVKAAMVDSAARVRVSEEARLQSEKTASEEKCGECGMTKHSGKCETKKEASAPDSTQVEKLANALDYLGDMFVESKEASISERLQGPPPGVTQATASTPLPDKKGQGVHVVPMVSGEQKAMPTERGATQMENTQNHAPLLHAKQVLTNNGKTASIVSLVRAKLAAPEAEKKETEGLSEASKGLAKAEAAHKSEPENQKEGHALLAEAFLAHVKKAEDAINPANISAGKAVPPDTSAAGESGGAPAGGMPQGPTSAVGSNQAAIDATKGQTHGVRREEIKKYLTEPALSAAHDNVLQVAFANTGKAGPKIASAQAVADSVKTASAKVLLAKLASSIDSKNNQTAE
jgi:hypothetical protein